MKKLYLILFLGFHVTITIAQPPQAFKYQAVVRNASGEIISNETIDVQISVLDGWAAGPVIYQETHSVSTNQFGLINLSIGWGTPGTGYNFLDIDWRLNEKFIEIEIWDDVGGTYISMGSSMLFSVPYALYSEEDGDWIKDGDNIYTANSGYVGIGTNDPLRPLSVIGSGSFSNASDWGLFLGPYTEQSGSIGTKSPTGSYFNILLSWGETVFNGNVGIGTTTPDAKLHVNDRIRIGEDPAYSTVYGELLHEGGGTGFKINAHAGGGSWADLHLQTNGTTKMFIESSGKVGIGTDSPIRKLQVSSTGTLDAIHGYSPGGTGVYAQSGSSYGIFGQSTSGWAGYFSGNVHVTGSLSKGGGSFVIDHPLDPENKLLRHNFVESPENLLIYRGKAELNEKGEAIVEMPDYFKALTKEDGASIHLTPVGRPFLTGAEWSRDLTSIIIYGDSNREVFWEVLADRDDPVIHQLGRPVEEEKGGKNSICEKGKLLYPEAYGYPESKSHVYEMKQMNK